MTRTIHARALALASVCAAFSVTAFAAPAGPEATVRKAMDQFNKGDMQDASAAFASDPSIIDEFAPYEWHGPNAVSGWLSAFGDFTKAKGQSNQVVKILSVSRSDVEGDTAYVVLRELYTYKEHGKPMSEMGSAAWTLHNGPDGWKIVSTAWAGSRPAAVVAAAKPKPAAGAPGAAAPAMAPAKPSAPARAKS